jgi:hypothetical protein
VRGIVGRKNLFELCGSKEADAKTIPAMANPRVIEPDVIVPPLETLISEDTEYPVGMRRAFILEVTVMTAISAHIKKYLFVNS